jgi:uncharacterized protein YfdQ (DUF2303 family)
VNTENPTETSDMERLVRVSTVHAEPDLEVPFVLVPDGYSLKDLESLRPGPRRIRETIDLHNLTSFTDYVNKWKDDDSVIFANTGERSLRAVLDYHNPVGASWGSHRANYVAKMSREAVAWMASNSSPQNQQQFAEFIEDRIGDVVKPEGADLLERVLKLQIITKATFRSALRLQTGQVQLAYSEEDENGTVELPEKIEIIPLFHNGQGYKLDARLRYRLTEGKVHFTYKLLEIDRAIEQAFDEVVERVRAVTSLSVLMGARGRAD